MLLLFGVWMREYLMLVESTIPVIILVSLTEIQEILHFVIEKRMVITTATKL
jgi:hypothetical protein